MNDEQQTSTDVRVPKLADGTYWRVRILPYGKLWPLRGTVRVK